MVEDSGSANDHHQTANGEDDQEENKLSSDKSKNKQCKGNPQSVTRIFLGNLPFAVDDTLLKTFLPGVTHIKWITDKETGKFYGSAFVEMETSAFVEMETSSNAADAVAKAGSQLMGRPMINDYGIKKSLQVSMLKLRLFDGSTTKIQAILKDGRSYNVLSCGPYFYFLIFM